jgi:hypothetical protein
MALADFRLLQTEAPNVEAQLQAALQSRQLGISAGQLGLASRQLGMQQANSLSETLARERQAQLQRQQLAEQQRQAQMQQQSEMARIQAQLAVEQERARQFQQEQALERQRLAQTGQIDLLKEQGQYERAALDRQNKVDIEQMKAGAEAPGKQFERENKLRDEYLKQADPFIRTNAAYERLKSAAENPEEINPVAIVFNYMQMVDPSGSATVREGQYADEKNSPLVPPLLRDAYNKVVYSQNMSPAEVKKYLRDADKLYKGQSKTFENTQKNYRRLSEQAGVNAENVTIPLGTASQQKTHNKIIDYEDFKKGNY